MKRDVIIGLLMMIGGAGAALAQAPQSEDPPTILRGKQTREDAATAGVQTVTPDSGSPTFLADPQTYKLLWEDASLRVIAVNWRGRNTDQPHTHPLPSVVYYLDDCKLIIHNADGTIRETNNIEGAAATVPMTLKPHQAENPGAEDCRAVIVERK